jgi:hypothetical protein
MVDERKVNNIAKGKRASTKDGLNQRGSDSANTNDLLEYGARVIENCATPVIPDKYKEFLHLF